MTGLAEARLPLKCLDYTVAMETGVKEPRMSSSTGTLHIAFYMDGVLFYTLPSVAASFCSARGAKDQRRDEMNSAPAPQSEERGWRICCILYSAGTDFLFW